MQDSAYFPGVLHVGLHTEGLQPEGCCVQNRAHFPKFQHKSCILWGCNARVAVCRIVHIFLDFHMLGCIEHSCSVVFCKIVQTVNCSYGFQHPRLRSEG